ncbi:MAG: DoxX family protein [Chlamydiia bacterium]|nr:DoxX family protein [Chlamydiia bacterium]
MLEQSWKIMCVLWNDRGNMWVARICFSLLFLVAGVGKLFNWQGSVEGLALTFVEWQMLLGEGALSERVQEVLSASTEILMGGAVFLEIVGALLILLGYKTRIGAVFLLLFLIPVTLVMHPFWFRVSGEVYQELMVFLKNLSLIGALLFVVLTPASKQVE